MQRAGQNAYPVEGFYWQTAGSPRFHFSERGNAFQSGLSSVRAGPKLNVEWFELRQQVAQTLIAGEAISSALKHAFSEPRRGAIRVGLHLIGEESIVLSVEDNRSGLPGGASCWRYGHATIEGMARGLSGTLNINGDQRTLIRVEFPSP